MKKEDKNQVSYVPFAAGFVGLAAGVLCVSSDASFFQSCSLALGVFFALLFYAK